MKAKILGMLAVAILSGPIAAKAATLQVNAGHVLTGALGVSVDGTLYDVAFQDGTCVELFAECDANSDFVFKSEAAASLASQALLDQVFVGEFDSTPWLIQGCTTAGGWCVPWTPYAQTAGSVAFAFAANTPGSDWVGVSSLSKTFDMASAPDTYAVWAPSTVPLPAAAWLLLSGLGGLSFLGRRRKTA